jgi:hypothetical protein
LARSKLPKNKKLYGAYPNGFLHRARELLGISIYDPLLHVCGGHVKHYPCRGFGPNDKTVDLNPGMEPDYLMDVREGLPVFDNWGWPAMLADPPYSEKDQEEYAKLCEEVRGAYPESGPLLRRMLEGVAPGGRVGLLHYEVPSPPSKLWVPNGLNSDELVETKVRFVALITVFMGYGNRPRAYSVFEKEAPLRFAA